MNPLRMQLVEAARQYLGTPFHHQGRVKGVGVDCIGLVACAAKDCGLNAIDDTTYPRRPDGETLQKGLEVSLVKIPTWEADVGDVLIFHMRGIPCHIGMKTDKGVIHTYAAMKKVVEHGLRPPWDARVCGAYRFKDLVE